MEPRNIGRTLGIGLRVAGRVAGKSLAETGHTAPAPQPAAGQVSAPPGPAPRESAARPTAKLGHGMAGFLKPFRRVGGTVMLEVTGAFFLLFVVVFAPTLWRTRMNWAHGPEHRSFVAAAIIVVVFFYLSMSAFWRARKR